MNFRASQRVYKVRVGLEMVASKIHVIHPDGCFVLHFMNDADYSGSIAER